MTELTPISGPDLMSSQKQRRRFLMKCKRMGAFCSEPMPLPIIMNSGQYVLRTFLKGLNLLKINFLNCIRGYRVLLNQDPMAKDFIILPIPG